jgi:hypothetical protein
LSLKTTSKKEAMDTATKISVITRFLWSCVSKFIYRQAYPLINNLRQLDGNTWFWDDGRISLVAPVVDSDKDGCWYYDALANSLSLCVSQETITSSRRMPWMSGTIQQNGISTDFSDILTDLTFKSPYGTIPSVFVIRGLLAQKLGFYVGGTAIFRVYCRSDLLNEKIFSADLEEENDIENWNSSWD